MCRPAVVVSLLLSVLLFSPASAYRVFLDHDTDGDLTTFRNEVVGPTSAPVTIVVETDPADAGALIHFTIAWDCGPGVDCVTSHGKILHDELNPPDAFPFSGTEVLICLSLDCGCIATRYYSTVLDDQTPAGSYALFVVPFTREGNDALCLPMTYSLNRFQVFCPTCNYAAGDEPKTEMVIREAPVGAEADSWGHVKARYDETEVRP